MILGRSANILSAVSQQRSSSGSPCSSIYIPSKLEFPGPESKVEVMNYANSMENNVREDTLLMNQLGLTPIVDSHNNTDDSFLTTASLIDESFKSAVTHLDENGEVLKNEKNKSPYMLNDSQNLDVLDSCNDTTCSSENGLENTMLKNGSFASTENRLPSVLDNSEEKALCSSQKNDVNDEKIVNNSMDRKLDGNNCMQSQECFETCSVTSVTDSFKKESLVNDDHQEDEAEKSEQTNFIPIEKEGGDCENPSREIQLADLFLMKSLGNRTKTLKNYENNSEKSSADSEAFSTGQETNIKNENDEVVTKTVIEVSESALENTGSGNISTTTIVLSEADCEIDSMFASLKIDDLEKSTSATLLEETQNLSPKEVQDSSSFKQSNSAFNIVKNAQSTVQSGKKSIGVDRNSTNKLVKRNKNKLNNSVDIANRKAIHKSPKGRKSFRQKHSEEVLTHLPKDNISVESYDYLTANVSDNSKPEDEFEVNETNNVNVSDKIEVSSSTSSFLQDSISLSSQQSYTIINSSDNNLKRPIINSHENVDVGSERSTPRPSCSTFLKDLEGQKTINDCTNECPNVSTEIVNVIPAGKQSTPVLEGNNLFNALPWPECNLSSSSSTLEKNREAVSDFVKPYGISSKLEFSPVTPLDGETFLFPNSVEKEAQNTSSSRNTPILNKSYTEPKKDVNLASENVLESFKINQTLEKKSDTTKSNKIDPSFDIQQTTQGVNKLTRSLDENLNPLDQTFDVPSQTHLPTKSNYIVENQAEQYQPQEFEIKDGGCPVYLEDTQKIEEEDIIEPKSCPTTIIERSFEKSDLSGIQEEVDSKLTECLSSSFISTTSSNASLLCNDNLTVLLNQEQLPKQSSHEIVTPNGTDSVQTTYKNLNELSDSFNRPLSKCDSMQSAFVDGKLHLFFKEEKLQCDPDLVKFIQEKFSSNDIEKIFNAVETMAEAKRLGEPMPNFGKIQNYSNEGFLNGFTTEKPMEGIPEKLINPLSPHSFDFLNSIGGKPTGRDLSRESLYVKFDPLVQAPNFNSLIDFTKEVEALDVLDSSPKNSSVVEHLLTISPQKKSDEIVPPLTPLSQKNKNILREDKTEKVKELQNEIYFLKNLYSERERANKAKMDQYETQIAKLTGQSCFLEDKLKESNEREKSLVKKVQEQKQSIEQLKTIMEEYVRVVTKLTSELDTIKSENKKQLTSLMMEKDSYMTHLQNTEAAFADVHVKYEKSKKTIINLKTNEAMFKNTLAEQLRTMEEYKEKAREAQEKAFREYEKLQEELNSAKSSHSQESARLRALLRKTELKLEAVQESLDQKIKENEQLTAICDEFIEGKK